MADLHGNTTNEQFREYIKGSLFYFDPGFNDGPDHENANGCDLCLEAAELMTFSNVSAEAEAAALDDSAAYYLCLGCLTERALYDLADSNEAGLDDAIIKAYESRLEQLDKTIIELGAEWKTTRKEFLGFKKERNIKP